MSETASAAPAAEIPASSESGTSNTNPDVISTEPKAAAPTTPAKKVEPPSTKKKLKLKVDGKEFEEEYDLGNEQELIKHFQKSKVADKRMNEYAELQKAAQQLLKDLKTNPRKVLSDPSIGIDVKKFAEEIINEQLAELEKSPEQREREEWERKFKEADEKSKKLEADMKQKEFNQLQSQYERELESEISAALDLGGLPKTAKTVARMAEMLEVALRNDIPLSVQDIVPYVKESTMSEFKEIINSLGDDQLEDFIGKEVIGRIRKKSVAKAKAIDTANSVKQTGASETQKKAKEELEKPKQKQGMRSFFGPGV